MSLPVRHLVRQLGLRSLAHYTRYQFQLRTGVLRRRTAPYAWEDRPLSWWIEPGQELDRPAQRSPLAADPESLDLLRRVQARSRLPATHLAEEILEGRFRLFGGQPQELGFPPEWLRIPLDADGRSVDAERHWSSYLDDGALDLRLLWELSRFGWAYGLGRAYLLSRERRYAEGFLALLESWRAANPPNRGPNWISAQEAALRVLALSFAWHAFQDDLRADPARRDLLLTTLAACADRIPPTLAYAQAQRNNHLITEAVGLYTAGLLLPQLRPAARWKAAGRRLLIAALDDQVLADGGYIQHSTNYHRLALSAGLWAARWAEGGREPLPPPTLEALGRLSDGLAALIDPVSGAVPNLGSNDGSDILPLSSCAHHDYRPVVQAASLALSGRREFGPGAWDELALWLGLELGVEEAVGGMTTEGTAPGKRAVSEGRRGRRQASSADRPERYPIDFPQAGLYLVRGQGSWAVMRCARYRSRPSQSDQLHLDLWWEGHNIARDPGSYRYTVSGLEGAAAHNTLTADGVEPMRRLGRFLWVARHPSRYLARWTAADGGAESIAAEQRLPGGLAHRRSVVRAGDSLWVVLDELAGSGEHQTRLSWLLPDAAWELNGSELRVQLEPGVLMLRIDPPQASLGLYRAGQQVGGEPAPEPESTVGWWAPSYGRRRPALTLVVRLRERLPLRLTSWWGLGELHPTEELPDALLDELLGGGQ